MVPFLQTHFLQAVGVQDSSLFFIFIVMKLPISFSLKDQEFLSNSACLVHSYLVELILKVVKLLLHVLSGYFVGVGQMWMRELC